MIRFVRFLLGALALDDRGQRAIDAALADWRHEWQRAPSFLRRLLLNVRSVMGVVRTLAQVGVAESPAAARSSFAWRLAAVAGIWVIWKLSDGVNGVPGGADRFFLVTSALKAWTLVAASLLPQTLVVLPVMVFLAEAVGRRKRGTPVVGALVVLSAIVALVGLGILPASAAYLRHETWRYFANASVPEPGANALLLSFLSVVATMSAMVGICVLFVFANRIRRVGGVTGWAVGLGVVFAAYIAGVLLQIAVMPVEVRIAVVLTTPLVMVSRILLMFAAILWATSRLATIESARASAL